MCTCTFVQCVSAKRFGVALYQALKVPTIPLAATKVGSLLTIYECIREYNLEWRTNCLFFFCANQGV